MASSLSWPLSSPSAIFDSQNPTPPFKITTTDSGWLPFQTAWRLKLYAMVQRPIFILILLSNIHKERLFRSWYNRVWEQLLCRNATNSFGAVELFPSEMGLGIRLSRTRGGGKRDVPIMSPSIKLTTRGRKIEKEMFSQLPHLPVPSREDGENFPAIFGAGAATCAPAAKFSNK